MVLEEEFFFNKIVNTIYKGKARKRLQVHCIP